MTPPRTVPAPASRRELYTVFAGLMLALTLASLDQNIVSTALPADRQRSRRPGASFLGRHRLHGHVYDHHAALRQTQRHVWPQALSSSSRSSSFSSARFSAGWPQTMFQLILFRAVQGLGAGGLITLAQTTVGDLIVPRERGQVPGPLRRRLRRLQRGRPAARRHHHRRAFLALDFLRQPAGRRGGACADRHRARSTTAGSVAHRSITPARPSSPAARSACFFS